MSARPRGFGEQAERLIARLPDDLPVLASDLDGAVLALEAAVERRWNGSSFFVAPLVDDPRAVAAQRIGGKSIERLTDVDDRYAAFDALAAGELDEEGHEEVAKAQEARRRVLRDFTIMGDALLVRSARDVERISRVLGRRRPYVVAAPGRDPFVPNVQPAAAEFVVVWAPHLEAHALGVIAMALEYTKWNIVYVCRSGKIENVRGCFVRREEASAVLERAACIVDASISDPAAAIALSRLGVPLAAAATTGASEFVQGLLEYEPWDWRSIFAAVSAAVGAKPPTPTRDPVPEGDLEATLLRTGAPRVNAEPLVSIVLATFNRPNLLAAALESIARQTYRNIEAIVVNNGGEDVHAVTKQFPFVRLIELPSNILPSRALAMAMETMAGDFYGIFSDDDLFYPDHIARLVYALQMSGAAVAHSNAATAYVSVTANERRNVAYRVRHDRPSDTLQLLVGATMVIHGMLFRRDVYLRLGGLAADIAPSDLEYQMRVAKHYPVVHVDAVTCQWNYRVDGMSFTHREVMLEGLRMIYERYPAAGSRIAERRRREELRRFEERTDAPMWPPDLLLPQA